MFVCLYSLLKLETKKLTSRDSFDVNVLSIVFTNFVSKSVFLVQKVHKNNTDVLKLMFQQLIATFSLKN